MATKTSKTPRRKRSRGHGTNYLIVGSDGTLLLGSGSTGEIRPLTPEQAKGVLPLLKQRQELGRQLATMLRDAGFEIGPDDIVDLEL
jgi:hypothetical protein